MYLPLEYTNVKKKKEKKSDQSLGEELTLPVYGVKLQKHPKAHDVNFTVNFPILLYPSEQVQTYHCYDHVKIPLYFQRCFVVIKKISRTISRYVKDIFISSMSIK